MQTSIAVSHWRSLAIACLGVSAWLLPYTAETCAAQPVPSSRLVWFGTYTNEGTGAGGIYVSRFDPITGQLTAPKLAATTENPSFLALHPTLPVLYAVSEMAANKSQILAWRIDEATGQLALANQQSSAGAGPCYLSVDRSGRVVLAANYGSGSVVCLGLNNDGSLRPVVPGSPAGFLQHAGSSLHKQRQAGPHAHSIDAASEGRFAVACDLGLDQILIHALDPAAATLKLHRAVAVQPGAGPRHFALHPNSRFGYAINELDLTVTAFAWDAQAGTLAHLQTLSTLPAHVADRTGFSTAEIVVHPAGKYLYASNRGHDSIAIYTIDKTSGKLTFVGVEPIHGKSPRHFVIDPSGAFLLAAGQTSDTISLFKIDQATGGLVFTGPVLKVPTPVCICFYPSP